MNFKSFRIPTIHCLIWHPPSWSKDSQMLTLRWAITITHLTHLLSIAGHLMSLSIHPHILSAELLFSFRSMHILQSIEGWIQQWSSSHCWPWSLKKQAELYFKDNYTGIAQQPIPLSTTTSTSSIFSYSSVATSKLPKKNFTAYFNQQKRTLTNELLNFGVFPRKTLIHVIHFSGGMGDVPSSQISLSLLRISSPFQVDVSSPNCPNLYL